jgi:hypothetical protein
MKSQQRKWTRIIKTEKRRNNMGAQLGLLLIILTGAFVLMATRHEDNKHAASMGD